MDVGVSASLLEDTVAALGVGARVELSRVTRGGIAATKADVYAHGEKDLPREVFQAQRKHDHLTPIRTIMDTNIHANSTTTGKNIRAPAA